MASEKSQKKRAERNPFSGAFNTLIGAAGWSSKQEPVKDLLLWELRRTMYECAKKLAESVAGTRDLVTISEKHFQTHFPHQDVVARKSGAVRRRKGLTRKRHDAIIEKCYDAVVVNHNLLLAPASIGAMLREMATEMIKQNPLSKGRLADDEQVRIASDVPKFLARVVQDRLMRILSLTKLNRRDPRKELSTQIMYDAINRYYELCPRCVHVDDDEPPQSALERLSVDLD